MSGPLITVSIFVGGEEFEATITKHGVQFAKPGQPCCEIPWTSFAKLLDVSNRDPIQVLADRH